MLADGDRNKLKQQNKDVKVSIKQQREMDTVTFNEGLNKDTDNDERNIANEQQGANTNYTT